MIQQVDAGGEQEPEPPEAGFATIVVPMTLGDIGEEMMATAVRVAKERHAAVIALNVIEVPLEQPLDAPLEREERQAEEVLAEARALGEENGVPVRGHAVRTRSIGAAVIEQARELGADLIVLGSGARWRRQSRFFSPTVEYVLSKAPCEVMIVSFPEDAFEGSAAPEPGGASSGS